MTLMRCTVYCAAPAAHAGSSKRKGGETWVTDSQELKKRKRKFVV